MRVLVFAGLTFSLLVGCGQHQYEPLEPGITVSGEAGVGVTYCEHRMDLNGKQCEAGLNPKNTTKMKISVGGSI